MCDRVRGTLTAVFVHGAGRSGAAAWPGQQAIAAHRECLFLERLTVGDDPETVINDLSARLEGPVHLVGHSYGAATALLVASPRADLVASLTLVEPAALAVSTRAPHTASHVAALAPVFAVAGDATVPNRQFAALFAEANGSPVPEVSADVLDSLTAQLRALRPPWTLPCDPRVVSSIPTLVLIGEDDGMYFEVAQVLAAVGAALRVFPGIGHRPHDRPEATELMEQHWLQVEAQR